MYIVNGCFKYSEVDNWNNGCQGNGHSVGIDYYWKSETLEDLIEQLKSFVGYNCDVQLDCCDEDGRIDIQNMEDSDGVEANDYQLGQWKAGEIDLYLSTYTFYVYKAELSKLIEGY